MLREIFFHVATDFSVPNSTLPKQFITGSVHR